MIERRRRVGPELVMSLEILAGDSPLDDEALIGDLYAQLNALKGDNLADLVTTDVVPPEVHGVQAVDAPWHCHSGVRVTWNYEPGGGDSCNTVQIDLLYGARASVNLAVGVDAAGGAWQGVCPGLPDSADDCRIRVTCEDDWTLYAVSPAFTTHCEGQPEISSAAAQGAPWECLGNATVTWAYTAGALASMCPRVRIEMVYWYWSGPGTNPTQKIETLTLATGVDADAETWTGAIPQLQVTHWTRFTAVVIVRCEDRASVASESGEFTMDCEQLPGEPAPLAMIERRRSGNEYDAVRVQLRTGTFPSVRRCGPFIQVQPVCAGDELERNDVGMLTIDCAGTLYFHRLCAAPSPEPSPSPHASPSASPAIAGACCYSQGLCLSGGGVPGEWQGFACRFASDAGECREGYCYYRCTGLQGPCRRGEYHWEYFRETCFEPSTSPSPEPSPILLSPSPSPEGPSPPSSESPSPAASESPAPPSSESPSPAASESPSPESPSPTGPGDCCYEYICLGGETGWDRPTAPVACRPEPDCEIGHCLYINTYAQGRCTYGYVEFAYNSQTCHGVPPSSPSPSSESPSPSSESPSPSPGACCCECQCHGPGLGTILEECTVEGGGGNCADGNCTYEETVTICNSGYKCRPGAHGFTCDGEAGVDHIYDYTGDDCHEETFP